jgi:hypothetical protein
MKLTHWVLRFCYLRQKPAGRLLDDKTHRDRQSSLALTWDLAASFESLEAARG